MKRPKLVSQGTLNRLLQNAHARWNQRDFQQAIELLERANHLDPANIQILTDLGHAYGLRYQYTSAEKSFERALRLVSRKEDLLCVIIQKAREFANPAIAIHYCEQALGQPSIHPETLVTVANLYDRFRRTEDAAVLIDRALKLRPEFPPALLAKAKSLRQSGALEEAEKLLRSSLTNAERDTQIRIFYELGGVLDRMSRYAEAMKAFLDAKALQRSEAQPHQISLRIVRGKLKLLRDSLTSEVVDRWLKNGPELEPARGIVLLCGHPRSGTTLLEQVIDSHPNILSVEETEIFHNEAYVPLTRKLPENSPILSILKSVDLPTVRLSRQNYFATAEKFLGSAIEKRLLIDKNPSLTFLIAPFLCLFPEAKFLIAIRDPRDVCLSCFMQPFHPVSQVSSAYLSLEETFSEYTELMAMYRTISPILENRCFEVRYEEMVDNLEPVTRKVLDFLEVDWNEQTLRFNEHAKRKMVRSPTYAEVAQPVFKRAIGRWHHYEEYLAPHLEMLAPFIKAFGYV